MRSIDEKIVKLLNSSKESMTFAKIKRSLGLSDKALTLALRRLQKYSFIRKILYYDMDLQKPKLLYVPLQDADDTRQSICIWLRKSVLLDNEIPCYYDVFLDWAGDKVDHDLIFTDSA